MKDLNMLRRLIVVTGAFGSGKTELALHLAHAFARGEGGEPLLVDLDIVNPYFRSSARRAGLEAAGVRVIAPRYAMTGVDVPALPPEVELAFEPGRRAVMDVGGDEIGAVALGRYRQRLLAAEPDVLFVVNLLRPMTDTADGILAVLERVAAKARVRPTMLVNNTNLQDGTELADVLRGQAVLEEASARCGLPVGLIVCRPELAEALPPELRDRAVPLCRRMRQTWDEA